MNRRRPILVLGALVALVFAAMAYAVSSGTVSLSPSEVMAALAGVGGVGGGAEPMARDIVLGLRLPRAAAAFATGGLLGLAGALMQVLLRNPLADPYILGVSGGAAGGALLALVLGAPVLVMDAAAFVGALASTLLVFALAHGRGGWTPTRLLLTGVVVAAGWGALISFLLVFSEDGSMRSMLFWLMGDLAFARSPLVPAIVLLAGLALALPFARQFNLLSRGDGMARALGVSVQPLQIGIYVLASLLTGAAVTTAGSIGFVGLVVPHLLRVIAGADHRWLLPGAVLLGGALLVTADTLARTVFEPIQLPVGVFTAAIGVPLFLFLLNRSRYQA